MEKKTLISVLLFGLAVILVVLHNAFFMVFNIEEGVLFLLALLAATAFVGSLIYNLIIHRKTGEPKDLWKIGFLGLLGLAGFIPGMNVSFFLAFAFFGFFYIRE